MSFVDLVDGFDICDKRTVGTVRVVHELGSYLAKYGQSKKDITKEGNALKAYTTKKLAVNTALDNTVKISVDSLVTEVEGLFNKELAFANRVVEISVEIDGFVKEQEIRRKKLVDESHRLVKEYREALDNLKKSKEKYRRLCQEHDSLQVQLAKAKTTVNAQKISQLMLKVNQAQERATQADTEYKETLKATNEKQDKFYTTEMPAHLKEFNQFETDRITFMKEKLKLIANEILEFPTAFERAGSHIAQTAESIDASVDISNFINANKTNAVPPAAIEYEPYNSVVPVASSSATTSPASPAATAAPTTAPTAAATPTTNPPPSATGSPQTAAAQPNNTAPPTSNLTSPSSSLSAPSRPPPPKTGVPTSGTAVGAGTGAAATAQTRPPPPSSTVKTGPPAAVEPVVVEEQAATPEPSAVATCKCRGLFEYTATCDNELSFPKDAIIEVIEQDETGWWYSRYNGKQGFIPKNYVAVI